MLMPTTKIIYDPVERLIKLNKKSRKKKNNIGVKTKPNSSIMGKNSTLKHPHVFLKYNITTS